MRFHVALPGCMNVPAVTQPWEPSMVGADVIATAKVVDQLGFDGVMVPEHFLTATSHLELSGNHYFDASTAQGVLVGATERVTVSSMLTILPLHHPIELAKAIATLDWLSGGRAAVTFGVGWQLEEFDAFGVDFHTRGRLADESLQAMFELWHSDDPAFHGEFFSFDGIKFGPKPIQSPHPKITLGGDAPAVLRRAARFADAWAPWLTPMEQIPGCMDQIRSSPEFDGREFGLFYSMAVLNVGEEHVIKSEHQATRDLHREVEQCGVLREMGVTDTWIAPPALRDLNEYVDHLHWVAEEVIPQVG